MNTYEQDRAWAEQVLGADPATEADVSALVEDIRRNLADRLHDEDRAVASQHSPLLRAVGAVAAALVLFLGAMPVVAGVTDPAWAVEQLNDGRIRVEFSSILGHGPDPEGLVAALQDQGVDARVGRLPTVWPLSIGRVVGLVTEYRPSFVDVADGLPDPADYGLEETGRGYILDPVRFREVDGAITIKVGQAPWES